MLINSKSPECTVKLLKDSMNGSNFGTCSCSVPQVDSVPCIQMMAVVKSGRIVGMTPMNVMPWWWSRRQWRLQLPENLTVLANLSMNTLKESYQPDVKLRYCPDWSTGRKLGRPKMGDRIKTAIEIGSKRKNQKHKYCVWCNKYNHSSTNCFNHLLRKDRNDDE